MPRHAKLPVRTLAQAIVFLLLLASRISFAQPQAAVDLAETQAPAATSPLRVGTHEAAPFAYHSNGKWSGIAIELWRQVAKELGRDFEIRELPLDQLFDELAQGKLDLAIGALSITAQRETTVDFSHAFYSAGLGIATRSDDDDSWSSMLARLKSLAFLKAMGALLLALGIAAALVFIFERRRDTSDFGGSIPQGIGASFWWSAVTMTTVGYGDKAPKTLGGRIVGVLWMFTSVVIVSTFTASIASSLTVTRLADKVRGPEDLAGVRVVAVAGSTGASYLATRNIAHVQLSNVEDALAQIRSSEADAVVYDKPVLQHLIGNQSDNPLMILGHSLKRENYGFALSVDSSLREEINRSLLRNIHSDDYKAMIFRYVGSSE